MKSGQGQQLHDRLDERVDDPEDRGDDEHHDQALGELAVLLRALPEGDAVHDERGHPQRGGVDAQSDQDGSHVVHRATAAAAGTGRFPRLGWPRADGAAGGEGNEHGRSGTAVAGRHRRDPRVLPGSCAGRRRPARRRLQAVVEREPVPAVARRPDRDLRGGGGDQPVPGHVLERARRGDRGALRRARVAHRDGDRDRSASPSNCSRPPPGRATRSSSRGGRSRPTRSSCRSRARRRCGSRWRPAHRHDLPAMAAAITDATRLIFVCNPNNPTGTALRRRELEAFLDAGAARRPRGARRGVPGVRGGPGRAGRPRPLPRPAERGRPAHVLEGVRAGGAAGRLRDRPRARRRGPAGLRRALRRLAASRRSPRSRRWPRRPSCGPGWTPWWPSAAGSWRPCGPRAGPTCRRPRRTSCGSPWATGRRRSPRPARRPGVMVRPSAGDGARVTIGTPEADDGGARGGGPLPNRGRIVI